MTTLITLFLAPLILLTLGFAVELLAGIRPLRDAQLRIAAGASAVIIVPAHDEEELLGDTLAKLKEAGGSARILVVADNCRDATAEIARGSGVEVIERFDSARRGKGFALDFAKNHLKSAPPEVVIIMDADCVAEPFAIERLLAACVTTGRPAQAVYLQRTASRASPTVQLSTFAFFIKNLVRQRALQRLAGRVHLLGTGMALPWSLFDKAELASGSIVEDLELGLELAHEGHPARFLESARVWSDAAAEKATVDQRRRWEGGYLQIAAKWGPSLLLQGIRRGDRQLLWTSISLFIPPIALLVTLDIAALIVAGLLYWLLDAGLVPLLLLGGALLLAGGAIVGAWARGGSQFISLRRLAQIPLYLAWKLPLYLGLAREGAPEDWTRTGRS